MKRSEQKLLRARLDAANREHRANAYDDRVEHEPLRYHTEGQYLAAEIEETDRKSEPLE